MGGKLKILLTDTNAVLIKAWKRQLDSIGQDISDKVEISLHHGYLDSIELGSDSRTAIVSPANSLGTMNGGFDRGIIDLFLNNADDDDRKIEFENYLRARMNSNGYAPVRSSTLVSMDEFRYKEDTLAWKLLKLQYLIVCPTMRVPCVLYLKKIEQVRFVFDCVWTTLNALEKCNRSEEELEHINTLIIPGIGTGCGELNIQLVAKSIVGAIYLWFLETDALLDKGLLCLSFLNEELYVFGNPDVLERTGKLFTETYEKFDILHQDVGDFKETLKYS